ncbi:response regulator [Mucilaginibacter lacusdianchii]|uniref:response regulator n=1 Tax=Mucilaginibacter lacusdianchii TaxID=2684211 RepID=UPI00131A6FFF|nr:response regulator [Mucilaginibacter sp. JXJ CY 39]
MPDIFYIEDDLDYIDIVESALTQVDQQTSLKSIDDGIIALQTLQQLADDKSLPRLVLLDWNLNGVSGLDILRKIRESQTLKQVPVVVFSTSDNPRDIHSSIEFGANAYVTKPLGYLNIISCLTSIHHFWLKTAAVVN